MPRLHVPGKPSRKVVGAAPRWKELGAAQTPTGYLKAVWPEIFGPAFAGFSAGSGPGDALRSPGPAQHINFIKIRPPRPILRPLRGTPENPARLPPGTQPQHRQAPIQCIGTLRASTWEPGAAQRHFPMFLYLFLRFGPRRFLAPKPSEKVGLESPRLSA